MGTILRIFPDGSLLAFRFLSYLLIPKTTETTSNAVSESKEREHISRLSALSNFSIGDIFKDIRDGPKSVKFPEKLLKVLEQKLQDIAMGKDAGCVSLLLVLMEILSRRPSYSDQLVRRTMAKFYGMFMVDSFKRQ